MIWIDITDVLEFLENEVSLTGIQRAALDLTASMHSLQGNIQTCIFCEEDAVFKTISFKEVLACVKQADESETAETITMKDRISRRILKSSVSLVPKALRHKLKLGRPRTRRQPRIPIELKIEFQTGDTFILVGAFWQNLKHADRVQNTVFVNDMKLALVIYDLIPVNHHDWFPPEWSNLWSQRLKILLRRSEYIFSISQFTAGEIRKFAADNRMEIKPVTVLKLGTPAFAQKADATRSENDRAATLQYRGNNFVLMVSTVDVRKNQKFLLPIWARLMKELGPSATPDLLLVGKNGTQSGEFFSRLKDHPELSGKIFILNRVKDRELACYYERSLFTVFPSLAEGWGFPVAESLSFGKICVSSDADAIPEVGGNLASYFPTNDMAAAYDLIRGLIVNPTERARLESTISSEFRRTKWSGAAGAMLTEFGPAV
jgi:glycosyltransferase involved in cell wall biosynthesis